MSIYQRARFPQITEQPRGSCCACLRCRLACHQLHGNFEINFQVSWTEQYAKDVWVFHPLSINVYIYIHAYIYIYIHIYVYTHIDTKYVHIYVYIYIYACLNYIQSWTCMYVYIYIYVYIHIIVSARLGRTWGVYKFSKQINSKLIYHIYHHFLLWAKCFVA